MLVESGHFLEVISQDLQVLEVEVGGVAPLYLFQFLNHLACDVVHVLKKLVGIKLRCLGGQLPGGRLLDVLIESLVGEAGRV